jgi:ParB-like chromosome segregation protein Spo0J
MTMLGLYTVHPFLDLFPLMEGEEFQALVDNIREHGLREPILLTADRETIVDGRNRYRACLESTTDPVFTSLEVDADEARIRDVIIMLNVKRRHLNPGQLSVLAQRLEPYFAGEAKERQGKKDESNIPAGAYSDTC